MAGRATSVKKYVVRLSAEEREKLQILIWKRKNPTKRLLKARILLKADVSELGEGWSDSKIIEALETSASMVYRVRRQLVEEGFEAVLSRKQRATPAVPLIFDGEKEAKLIALACSKPPKGRARWSLRLLENKVVELNIVDHASDSTIGRTLKKHSPAPSPTAVVHPAESQQRVRSRDGRRAGRLHAATRSRLPAGLSGRDLKATPRGDARADPDETGAPGPLRLRVRAQRHRQPLHDVCTARRLASHQGHRSPCRRGLRSRPERPGRRPLLERQDHRSASGQSQHPQHGVTLRSLSGRRSQAAGRALRMALHSKARQLARSGGVRTRCPIVPVPRPSHSRQTDPRRGNRRLAARPQCQQHQGQLALHNPKCTYQTQAPLPFNLTESGD